MRPSPLPPPANDMAREALLRRMDTKAAIASAAMEALTVPADIRALLDQYADGTLSATELVNEGRRIHELRTKRL